MTVDDPRSRDCTVLLDGVKTIQAVAADTDEGWIDAYVPDPDDPKRFLTMWNGDGYEAKIDRFYGRVEILLADGAAA